MMGKRGGLSLKWRLRCGLGGRLLEWHSWKSSREEQEERETRDIRDKSESHFSPVPSVSGGAHPNSPISCDSIVNA